MLKLIIARNKKKSEKNDDEERKYGHTHIQTIWVQENAYYTINYF